MNKPELPKEEIIRSIYRSNSDILKSIKSLHCPNGFECDMTYGNGSFWKDIDRPELCFDITPLKPFVIQSDSRHLPIADKSIESCVFDPPFLTYIKNGRKHCSASGKESIMSNRFGGYWSYKDLEDHYRGTLAESYRVLRKKGLLIFKCQDIIHDHKMHSTHINIIQWADGFRLRDLFILEASHRIPVKASSHGKQTQKHARIYHSYFLVLEKL